MVLYLATTKVNFLKAVTSYMKILYLTAGILGICHKKVIQSIKKTSQTVCSLQHKL